jgi:uncharacterized damage-inducible protein DinB
MLIESIHTSYEYDRWATGHILDTAAELTPEQLNAPFSAGHGSIRQTLLHLIVAQKRWLSWWDGSLSLEDSLGFRINEDDYPDVAAVRRLWENVETQTFAFLDGLTDDDAQRAFNVELPWGLPSTTFALWQMMQHVANHGTQHRSEVAAMLTTFDRSPGDLDLLFYFFDQLRVDAAQ